MGARRAVAAVTIYAADVAAEAAQAVVARPAGHRVVAAEAKKLVGLVVAGDAVIELISCAFCCWLCHRVGRISHEIQQAQVLFHTLAVHRLVKRHRHLAIQFQLFSFTPLHPHHCGQRSGETPFLRL